MKRACKASKRKLKREVVVVTVYESMPPDKRRQKKIQKALHKTFKSRKLLVYFAPDQSCRLDIQTFSG
jgi:F0F1-type ATP synthase delta subunit